MGGFSLGDAQPAVGRGRLELAGTCDFCDEALGAGGGMRDRRVPGATLCTNRRCVAERAMLSDDELVNVIEALREP